MMRGFWNDLDGLTIDEFAALLVLPLFLFVGVKMAIADDISSTQVDFFTVLTYPILAVVARKAVERFGFPALGRRQQTSVPVVSQPVYSEPQYAQAHSVQQTQAPPDIAPANTKGEL
jgi:hypothetical protein